jgi:hypothetical protein
MSQRILWYTFALVALFLVLTRYDAANALLRGGRDLYIGATGVLQGRNVTLTSGSTSVGAIAR